MATDKTDELSDMEGRIVTIVKEKCEGCTRSEVVRKLYGVGNVFQVAGNGMFTRDIIHRDVEHSLDGLIAKGVLSKMPKSDVINPLYCIRIRPGADLRGIDLRCKDLSGLDLQGVNMTGTDLRGTNLSGANLTNAILADADLRGADLTSVILDNTDFYCARVYQATLTEHNIRYVQRSGGRF